jgi:hypothetical protein
MTDEGTVGPLTVYFVQKAKLLTKALEVESSGIDIFKSVRIGIWIWLKTKGIDFG